jgi:hypothetical protein
MVVVKRTVVFEQQFASSLSARQQYTPGLHWSTFQTGTLEPPPHEVVASNPTAAVNHLQGPRGEREMGDKPSGQKCGHSLDFPVLSVQPFEKIRPW